MQHRVTVTEAQDGMRLDVCLAACLPEFSRAQIKRLIDQGRVHGPARKASDRVRPGWAFDVDAEPQESVLEPEAVEFRIVYSDEHLVVVDKPAGLVVHPAPGHRRGTLVQGLLHRVGTLAGLGSPLRPGVVHRLDKDTSGLIVVARTDSAYQSLAEQIADRKVGRTYTAIVCGHMKTDQGTIDAAIGRSRRDRKLMRVGAHGKAAVTHFEVTDTVGPCDILHVTLGSGRTHQIRVHLRHLGKPVFGDPTYGGRGRWVTGLPVPERRRVQKALEVLPRQALHAAGLSFVHPARGERQRFQSDLPEDIRTVMEILRG